MRFLVMPVVVGMVSALGCGGAESGPAPARGAERAPCRPDASCDDGLVCLSNRCVRPPGADCRLVAEALTTLELGNYAPREERTRRERILQAQCEREHLTKADGECILTAPSKEEVVWCPKPLIAPTQIGATPPTTTTTTTPSTGICETYVRTLERFARCPKLPADSARALRMQIGQLRSMYAQYGTNPSAIQSCQMANDATTQAMVQVGC